MHAHLSNGQRVGAQARTFTSGEGGPMARGLILLPGRSPSHQRETEKAQVTSSSVLGKLQAINMALVTKIKHNIHHDTRSIYLDSKLYTQDIKNLNKGISEIPH